MMQNRSPRRSLILGIAAYLAAGLQGLLGRNSQTPIRSRLSLVKDDANNLVKDVLAKLDRIKDELTASVKKVEDGAANLVKGLSDEQKAVADKLKADVRNMETAMAELSNLVKSKPADAKDMIRRAMLAAWKGDQSLIKALDSGFLAEDKVRDILPTLSADGFDLMSIAYVKTVNAASTDIGLPALTGLGRGAETASDFAAVSVNIAMPLAWQFLGYSQQEFNVSNLSIADENSRAFFVNRMETLAKEFVEGTGSGQCKGYEAYATTTTDQAGKLRLVKAVHDATVAQIRAAIIEARNKLPQGRAVVVFNGTTKTLLESEIKANGEKYFETVNGRLMYEGCEVWRNDNVADVAENDVFAVVMLAGRGYGVGVNPQMVLSSAASGSKLNLYTGQGLGGAILDHAAIYGITKATA